MNIEKWFKNLSLKSKLILVYVLLAVLPILAVTLYNYKQTKNILLEQSYKEMYQNIEQTQKSLNAAFDNYATIMDLLYTNQMLNNYLNINYSDISFWEMFYYIDQQLGGIMLVNANMKEISFYSSNTTLPSDNYYFYPLSKFPNEWTKISKAKSGRAYITGTEQKAGKEYLCMNRLLNYFNSGEIENILQIKVDTHWIKELLLPYAKTSDIYLVNESGEILVASAEEMNGKNIESLTKEWNDIPTTNTGMTLEIESVSRFTMARETSLGTKLILITDQSSLIQKAENVAHKILGIFFCSSFLMILTIWSYSEWMSRRVDKVVYASKKLGDGEFDYRLQNMGGDEIGLISDAINTLNDKLKVLIRENYEKKLLLKSSEVNLMQEQINPHFLYNALAVISSMAIREGGKNTVQGIKYLADFYRISLSKGKQVISIQEELLLLQNYMKIQLIRFGDSVEISYDADRQILPLKTIKLLLQPLVENAIHHARYEEEILHIQVRVKKENQKVVFEVEDDGMGILPEKLVILRNELRQSQEGYGLKNVDIRVKLYYGNEYGATIQSVYERGTTIKVEIPVSSL